MRAVWASAVITRGLETTSPRPSICAAESSISSSVPRGSLASARAKLPAGFCTGKLTLSPSIALKELSLIRLVTPVRLPEVTAASPGLAVPWLSLLIPNRTPSSLLKSSLAITTRDSINTWRTGISSSESKIRTFARLELVSFNQQGIGTFVDANRAPW